MPELQRVIVDPILPLQPPLDVRRESRFVARQPIFDRAERIHGYELLFRSGLENWFNTQFDPDVASRSTIDMSLLVGTKSLTGGHKAFINFTRPLLIEGTATILPREFVVIEVLEEIEPDADVVVACRELKRAGYTVALDDFDGVRDRSLLIPYADILKVDFRLTTQDMQREIAMRYRGKVELVAEKIENRAELNWALSLGYSYFQGFYFCKPNTIQAMDIPSLGLSYLKILRTALDEDFNVRAIEAAIKHEPGLCLRLLRYLNSPAFGLFQVTSLSQAITMLGQRELRKWLSVAATMSLAGPSSTELINLALARARTCELLANSVQQNGSELFLLGLLSLFDALLDRPMEVVIRELPVADPIREALLEKSGELRTPLDLAIACERGDWPKLQHYCSDSAIDSDRVETAYSEALSWVGGFTSLC